ncbi:MAG: RiPP maturation radical SAM C-methyltransferase [Thermoanaerobaculia bacterium]
MANSTVNPLVRFVAVPFLPAHHPALGISSLLSVLQEHGIPGDVHYLNLGYGEQVGWDFYEKSSVHFPSSFLTGEMIFTRALWGDQAPDFARFEKMVTRRLEQKIASDGPAWEKELEQWKVNAVKMRAAVEDAPRVVAEWADVVLAGAPRVLGFTSTFQQNIAALALAREVRRRVPAEEVAIIFGGANCEDDMGRAMADNFDFIDCVVSGEAEEIIVDLVCKLMAGGSEERPPRFIQGPMVTNMDALPLPDFDDYFAAVQQSSYCGITVRLAAESSRGCWWGLKSHCTFCGLNGGTMAFRGKSAARFASELETLSQKYGMNRFALTDNILDMSYLRTLIPELVAHGSKYKLFYETKSNLRKDQVELLAAAGVYMLQPGIESFSTPILKLMGKGTSRLQNIQLLKWCSELGVAVIWNLLFGFPGEEPDEYRQMAELLPSLYHLAPPMGYTQVRIDRFGPYWKWPERHGLINMRHGWAYDLTFAGVPEPERERLAYFFDFNFADGRDVNAYTRPTAACIDEWRKKDGGSIRLELRRSATGASVIDTRPCRREEVYTLAPQGLALVQALDGIHSGDGLIEAVRGQGVEISEAECESLLADFLARRFVIEENGAYLSLIVDPEQRARVAERQVALRLNRFGFRWPEDFPDPAKQQVVRAAMLALGTEGASASAA